MTSMTLVQFFGSLWTLRRCIFPPLNKYHQRTEQRIAVEMSFGVMLDLFDPPM